MTRCVECGHSYFAATHTGHRSGLCVECRLRKAGGLGPVQSSLPLGVGCVTLREAAQVLGLKKSMLRKPEWLARLGAVKVGGRWWVSRTALGRRRGK